MWQTILLKVLKYILDMLYDYVDKNNDGKLDKKELTSIKGSITRLKNNIIKIKK